MANSKASNLDYKLKFFKTMGWFSSTNDSKKEVAKALDGQFINNDGRTVTGGRNSDNAGQKNPGGHWVSTGDRLNHTTKVYDKDGKLVATKPRGNG